MQICPYCSFSNSSDITICLGCGMELPLDHTLGVSLAELGQEKQSLPSDSNELEDEDKTEELLFVERNNALRKEDTALQKRKVKKRHHLTDDVLNDVDVALDTLSIMIGSSQLIQDDDDAELDPKPRHLSKKDEENAQEKNVWQTNEQSVTSESLEDNSLDQNDTHTSENLPMAANIQERLKKLPEDFKHSTSGILGVVDKSKNPFLPESSSYGDDPTRRQRPQMPPMINTNEVPELEEIVSEEEVHRPDEQTAQINIEELQNILQQPLNLTEPSQASSLKNSYNSNTQTNSEEAEIGNTGATSRFDVSSWQKPQEQNDEKIEELGVDSIVEEEHELNLPSNASLKLKLETQKTHIFEPSKAQEATALDTSSWPAPTNIKEANSDIYSLLSIRLDAENRNSGAPLKLGKRLLALEGLKDRISMLLRALELDLEVEDIDYIVASSKAPKNGIKILLEGAYRVMEEVIQNKEDLHSDTQVRLRCVLASTQQPGMNAQNRVLKTAHQLLAGMPVDQIWLDWASHESLGQEVLSQEVILPSLNEPAYELIWQQFTPSKDSTLLQKAHHPLGLLVGREKELQILQRLWQKTNNSFQFALISGEPGSGRSRLLESWVLKLPRDTEIFWGGASWCGSKKVASPYLNGLVESHLQRHGFEQDQGLLQKIGTLRHTGAISEHEPWQEKLDDLLELWDRKALAKYSWVESLAWYIEATARDQPTLLLLDDLYLFDRYSRQLIEQLLRKQPSRLMVVALSSPGEYEALFIANQSKSLTIELESLSYQESTQLLQQLWPNKLAWDEVQVQKIIAESEGNPRILIAHIETLQQQNKNDNSTYMDDLLLPSSVEKLLLKQLKGLDSLQQDTLRKAAIIGENFWQGAIESLERMDISNGGWGMKEGIIIARIDDRSESLRILVEKKLIKRVGQTSLLGEKEYQFNKKAFYQVLLKQIPISVRQQLHRKIVQWLLLRYEHQQVITELIAGHLSKAGDYKEAAQYLYYAGKQAQQQGQQQRAIKLLSDAIEALGKEGPASQRLQVLESLADSYLQVGDLNGALHLYQSALQLSWQLTSKNWAGILFGSLGSCLALNGEFEKALDSFHNANALLKDQNKTSHLLENQVHFAELFLLQGKTEEAESHIQEAKRLQEQQQDPKQLARIRLLEGWNHRLQGNWGEALTNLQDATHKLRGMGDIVLLGISLSRQGEFHLAVGDPDTASSLFREATDMLRQHEAYRELIFVQLFEAHASLMRRSPEQALKVLEEAWQHVQSNGESLQISQTAAALAAAHGLNGQGQKAKYFARLAEQKIKDGPALQYGLVYYFLGEAASTMTPDQAIELFEQHPSKLPEGGIASYLFIKSLELFKQAGEKARFCYALLALARSLSASDNPKASENVLERASKEAQHWGLGLLLERIQNQKRLLLQQNQPEEHLHNPSLEKGHSTLIVRTPLKSGRRAQKRSGASSPPRQSHPQHNSPNYRNEAHPPAFTSPPQMTKPDAPRSPHAAKGINLREENPFYKTQKQAPTMQKPSKQSAQYPPRKIPKPPKK